MSDLYRDFIDQKADQIINGLGGTITPAPANAELYRDFLDRKFDDVITAIGNITRIKKHTYIGTGTNPNVITFPDKPEYIFSIEGPTTQYNWMCSTPIVFGKSVTLSSTANTQISTAVWYAKTLTYSGNSMSITGGSPEGAFNANGYEYTVYYI